MGKIFRRIRYAEVRPEADPHAVGARNVPAARNSINCGDPLLEHIRAEKKS
jgi:hypothetical protein